MAPITRRGPTFVNDTNPNNMTPESIQAMIDQALLRNSTNGDGSHSSHRDNRRNVQTTRPCFYADFMKCQPLNFKGTEGMVGLTRWIEKMESVFNISGCAIENQVKFATCTMLGAALTWWNGQIRTLGPRAYAMTWEVLKKKMTDKYCPQGEIKKLEIELWNLKKVDKYISGLPDNIYGNVKSSAPTRKGNLTTRGRLMIHLETTMATNSNPSRGRMSPRSTIWGQEKGSDMEDLCPNVTSAISTTMARAPRVGNAEKKGNAPGNPDANVVTGTFLLNNHYASILFDTGADRSFISTAFSSLINIAPTPLENCYEVELADRKLVRIDSIIRGCTLNFLDHPFNIDLMPIELGSFDIFIGMDWLRRCHAMIVCDEKLVQIPYGQLSHVQRLKGTWPIVQDFHEVFPEDLPGLPPA
ncbi:putative reverse transcriptase domain-containing protein [Tanacetum coccineum]